MFVLCTSHEKLGAVREYKYSFISISLAILRLLWNFIKILSEMTSACAAEQTDSMGNTPGF